MTMKNHPSRWHGTRRALQDRGTAAIEFALIIPLFAVMVAALFDLGYAAYESMAVQAAAEAGAQYASTNAWNVTAIENAVTGSTELSGISATPAPSEFCACANGSTLTAVSCTSTCSGGGTPGTYGLISAQVTHYNLLPYPGLSTPVTISAAARRRLQ
jgi:Flp pilus assembly protein TadG